jgi:hypothetical protein
MAFTQYQQVEQDRYFYADPKYIKNKIFECTEAFKIAYADYYNIKVNRNKEHIKKLNELRRTFRLLHDEIRPKVEKYGHPDIKEISELIKKYETNQVPIPFELLMKYKNYVIDWIEKTGLSKIELEQVDQVAQAEKECYDQ